MPQWAGSCWYYLRYLDPANSERLVDPAVERYWMVPPDAAPGDGGVDLYVGGVEHAVLHLLYARFWHKVLYDLGYLSTREPFRRLFNQGYILADAYLDARGMYVPAAEVVAAPDGPPQYQGQPVTARAGKMGKSLKNGISPDDIYAGYGADTLRLYEMAMGPLDADRPWRTNDIVGVYRFLQRLWRNIIDEDSGAPRVHDQPPDDETARLLHHTVKVVRQGLAEPAVQHRDRPPDGTQHPRGQAGRGSRWAPARAGRAAGPHGGPVRAAHRRRTLVQDGSRRVAGV